MTDWKWEDVEPETDNEREEDLTMWKSRVMGEYRIGQLEEANTDVGKFENSVLYVFDGFPDNEKFDENHVETWKIWGNKNLNDLMKKIKIGDIVKVQFVGTHPSQKGKPWQEFKVQKAGGEPSGSSSSTKKLPSMTEALKKEPRLDDAEILDMAHESETKTSEHEEIIKVARGWLNKITNDMIGEQRTVDEKTLKIEVYELSKIPTKDKELGVLEEEMAKEVFRLIDQKRC